ncbi:diguanylate cyclase [Hujiaoplasma nucleasis]|uniref:Diguanylate cyclase n=1 Tax=Hujiaoplasma nucleasis TaxID=2725268 RepID=A0A7L6N8A3_9MOLU|nr:diguanylate cyclase [Hujiaoplasma nucleasis]QLY40774.1 diguanylate cyclase [Hujiaoplasma nucleasis]
MPETSDFLQNNLDAVEKLLEKAKDAEHKDTSEALKLSLEALSIAKKHHYIKQEAKADMRIGRCHWINGNFKEAIDFLSKSLKISDKINDAYTKVDALIGLGNVYVTIEILDQAISQYMKALTISKDNGFGELESKILNNIGTMHEDLKNYPVALDYYQKSLDKTLEIEDTYGQAIAYLNIGNVYFSLNDMDKSEENFHLALNYGRENDKSLLLAHCYYSLGRLHHKRGDVPLSKKYLELGIEKANESKDLYILFRILSEYADIYDQLKDYNQAHSFYQKALDVAKQIGMDELMPRFYEQVAHFYEKNNKLDLAYESYKLYNQAYKIVEENRRLERINSLEYQEKLKASLEETRIYRQLSNELRKSYQQMHVLSNIGQAMTSTHQLDLIFEQLYENVNLLMNAESLGVGLFDEESKALRFDLFIERGKLLDPFSLSLENKKSWSVWSFLNKEVVKINDIEKEYKRYIAAFASTRGDLMHSAMYAPLMVEGEVIGVFSIQAKEKNAYTDTHQDLLTTLSSYLAIAIKNATKTKQLAELNQKLKILSENDGLTSIPNRRLYDDVFSKLWMKAINQSEPLSIMMVDIDNFKDFNDHYGHLIGDEVIKKVAHLLNEHRRNENDFVARYGGDEFVIILPNCDIDEAEVYAKELQVKLAEISDNLEVTEPVTISIGLCTTQPNSKKSKDIFVSIADNQLYISKENGKNCVSSSTY